jgi:hypothetical protein
MTYTLYDTRGSGSAAIEMALRVGGIDFTPVRASSMTNARPPCAWASLKDRWQHPKTFCSVDLSSNQDAERAPQPSLISTLRKTRRRRDPDQSCSSIGRGSTMTTMLRSSMSVPRDALVVGLLCVAFAWPSQLRAAAGDNVLQGLDPLTVPVSVLRTRIELETTKVVLTLSPEGKDAVNRSLLRFLGWAGGYCQGDA